MHTRKKFIAAWKTHYDVLTVPLYTIFMIVFEEILEAEFQCPRVASLKKFYVFSYFCCPAFIIFFLSLICRPDCIPCARCVRRCSFCRLCEIVATALLPPAIWCVILFCDGQYVECLTSPDADGSAKNINQSRAVGSPSESRTKSQIAGLYILTAVVFVCGVCYLWPCWFCCNNEEGHQKEKLQSLLEGKVMEYVQKKKEESAELAVKQVEKDSLQHVSNNAWIITAKKVKKAVDAAVEQLWKKEQDGDEPEAFPLASLRSS